MKILLNDYSGHPFPFELSQHLSKKFHVIHAYAGYFESPRRTSGGIETLRETKICYGLGIRLESSLGILGIDYGIGEEDSPLNGKVHIRFRNAFWIINYEPRSAHCSPQESAIMMGAKAVFFLLKYPANFLLYFFLGIAIKLRFLDLDKQKWKLHKFLTSQKEAV